MVASPRLFPEGVSHDDPFLQELKTGAARLYYRAKQLCDETGVPPVIVPVGLHYDNKTAFRSDALVEFHAPLQLPRSSWRRSRKATTRRCALGAAS